VSGLRETSPETSLLKIENCLFTKWDIFGEEVVEVVVVERV
jgi:hypothetical protein